MGLTMNHFQKAQQKGREEFDKKFSNVHLFESSSNESTFRAFMATYSEDLRKAVIEDVEELIKSKATLKTYFGDEYCSVDGFLEALKEKYDNH